MSERTEYAAGHPELGRPGVAGSGRVGRLLLRPVRLGDRGCDAGGIRRRVPHGDPARQAASRRSARTRWPGRRPGWNTYFTVDDADAAAAAAADAGGKVLMEPFDVMDAGRMAVLADPAGAVFMLWQPKETIGAELVNEDGAWSWSELVTDDVEGSKRFYGERLRLADDDDGVRRRRVHDLAPRRAPSPSRRRRIRAARASAECSRAPIGPTATPNFWLVYFAVADVDATVSHAPASSAGRWPRPRSTPRASGGSRCSAIRRARSSR